MSATGNAGAARRTRRWIGSALVVAAAVAALPGSAFAARSPEALTVSPAKTLGSKSIVVSWHTDRAPRAGRKYLIELQIDNQGARCTNFAQVVVAPTWKKGATVKATLRANTTKTRAWWCAGKGAVLVSAYSNGLTTPLARKLLEVRSDPKSPAPTEPEGTPVRIDLLAGSAMTVKVPGRPDRSAPLTGTMRGFLPGRFKPNTDLRVESINGTVTVNGLAQDPLCQSNRRPTTTSFDVVTSSSMVLLAAGTGFLAMLPSEELIGVSGCQPGPLPPATRALALTGKVGPAGLVNFTMSGSIGDIALVDGALATITLTLATRIDLSGQ